jgi:hypothetical protein
MNIICHFPELITQNQNKFSILNYLNLFDRSTTFSCYVVCTSKLLLVRKHTNGWTYNRSSKQKPKGTLWRNVLWTNEAHFLHKVRWFLLMLSFGLYGQTDPDWPTHSFSTIPLLIVIIWLMLLVSPAPKVITLGKPTLSLVYSFICLSTICVTAICCLLLFTNNFRFSCGYETSGNSGNYGDNRFLVTGQVGNFQF